MATLQEAVLFAFDLHQQGRLAEADEVYRQILDAVPDFPPALHLRGLVFAQSGRVAEGAELIGRAVAADGSQPDYRANLANLLEELGRPAEAVGHLAAAVALDPGRAGLLNNFAVRRLREGAAGLAAEALGHAAGAMPLAEEVRFNLGLALAGAGRPEAAAAQYRIGRLLSPGDAGLQRAEGEQLFHLGRVAEAAAALARALRIDPLQPMAWNLLGCARREEAPAGTVQALYHRGLSLDPASPELWNNLSSSRKALDDLPGAVTALRRALALKPGSPEILNNLADALYLLGRTAEALALAGEALATDPGLADARILRAMALLSLGRFAEGWQAWEERWTVPPWSQSVGRFPQPEWRGQPLGDRRLLVWGEQGIGDEIQFAAPLPGLVEAGVRCVLECEPRLIPLLARSLPEVELVARRTPPDPRLSAADIGAQIPSGSLPRLLLTDEAAFGGLRPFLTADPARVAALRAADADPAVRLRIGIAWHTSNPKYGRTRNIPLPLLTQALALPGVRLVVLQYGDWSGPVAELAGRGVDIVTPPATERWDDLDGLAARIAATDLVVSIDNVTVHMAGALGHPVWALLAHGPDWRWLRDRPDALWYPASPCSASRRRRTGNRPCRRSAGGWRSACPDSIRSRRPRRPRPGSPGGGR
ncbi:tetratricopeptide repeat protein [Azospirillum thermophilum]|uniref:tetratricopeptide repeat protein n=1 Tax=Azospirillum thermophilum TaxID=2202148 RepID=UPI001FE959F5|nr:tetratricopeptide repeat protein [Azospirillum thermophilum]